MIEEKIEVILEKIRPYLNNDGGNVTFIKYEDGVVYVKLTGACSQCSLADETLKSMIETALTFEIPEVIKVINVEDVTAE